MKAKVATLAYSALAVAMSTAVSAKPFTVNDLVKLDKVHSATVSPDGRFLVYGHKQVAETSRSDLWLLDLNKADATPNQLTNNKKTEHDVVWSRDSQSIYFLSNRSGSSQVWRLPLTGGEAMQVSDLPLDVNGIKLSPDNTKLALTMAVFADCADLTCSADRFAKAKAQPERGHVYKQLMVRHWDTWKDDSFNHVFVGELSHNGNKLAKVTDLTPGWETDIPAKPFSGMEEVAFTPDNAEVVFSAKAPGVDQSWHTNYDLYQVSTEGGPLKNLTQDNKAWDSQPVFSPDGRYMVYAAMSKEVSEADRFAIMLKDLVTGKIKEVAPLWDRSVRSMKFAADSRNLYITAQDLGQVSVFVVNTQFGDMRTIFNDGSASIVGTAGDRLIIQRNDLDQPTEIYSLNVDGSQLTQLTHVNDEKLKDVEFGEFSQFSFKGWNDETVYGYWVKPVGFKEGQKYPIAYLIHGGPQGSFSNKFHVRWNAQLWAAAGYGVVMVDFHGSTGYGQAFTDSISGDWGGKPFEDLQKGLKAVTEQQPWLDYNNACALGGSYGGYMVNWIAGNWSDQFKCLVNHAGLFDMRMFYNVTEELWFPEREMGGSFSLGQGEHEKFNPVNYVENWKTPMLVIHGEKDFRVPYGQGLAAFTTLQRKGIPSELLMYSTENHWILNDENKIQWYENVLSWMDRWTKQAD